MKPRSSANVASSSKRQRTSSRVDSDEDIDDAADTAGPSSSRPSADEQHNLVMARLDSLADSISALSTNVSQLSSSFTAFSACRQQDSGDGMVY